MKLIPNQFTKISIYELFKKQKGPYSIFHNSGVSRFTGTIFDIPLVEILGGPGLHIFKV